MDDLHKRVEEQIPRMRRYARALTRDVDRADDLVQDTLCRALSKLHLWQEGTDLRAWLFTILHNQYVNQVRRGVREGLELTPALEQTMCSRQDRNTNWSCATLIGRSRFYPTNSAP